MTIKIIRGARDVEYVTSAKIKPGMIIAEGIVYETHSDARGGKWLTTRAATIYVADNEAVQVYARLDDAATAQFTAAVAEDERAARRQ